MADHLWLLICTCLVFFMQVGFVCYEVGFVQPKNVISVAMENIVAFVAASLAFYCVGFSFMFGRSLYGLIGTGHWMLMKLNGDYDYIFALYQMMFAATSVTIFSGSMSERTSLKSLVIAAVAMGAVIYPVFGHWAWGGIYSSQPTLLSQLGYMDYAGATVVHSTAGWVALAGSIAVGPRKGRWDEYGRPKRLGRSNIPFATVGMFILWFAWFGFNGGSLLKFDDRIGEILLNTNLAACAGVAGAVVATFLLAKGQSLMEAIFNGALGGLVAITAGSDMLDPVRSILVGLIAGAVVTLGSLLLLRLHIDDAVNAVPIHAFGGVCGALLCVLFAPQQALSLSSRLAQLGVQMLGVLINFAWSFGMATLMFQAIKKIAGLRVSEQAEKKGLNIVEFSDVYSWMHYLKEENYENLTQDLSETIKEQNAMLRRQADMLVVTQEKEREKIARDLHDGVGQSLVALKINLGLLQNGMGDEKLREQTGKIIRHMEGTIAETRDVILNLRPMGLEKDGLAQGIHGLCGRLRELSGIDIQCNVSSDLPPWNETEEINIYRIVQECLTNILKHSGANEAEVALLRLGDRLALIRIADNGVGFDRPEVQTGFGLTTIRERADMLGAKLLVESARGKGTRILLEVPCEND